jgi:arylsulfatase A
MNRKRRIVFVLRLAAAALLWIQTGFADETKIAARKPNIVVILADDLGYGDVSCLNPESKIQTPHIDALAKAGVLCTDAHSPSAVCSPTRYSLLTGRYAWRHRTLRVGVLPAWDPPVIEPQQKTVPRLLGSAGYDTACIGKWHLGFDWPWKQADQYSKLNRVNFHATADMFDWSRPLGGGPLGAGFHTYFGLAGGLYPLLTFVENDRINGPVEDVKTDTLPTSGAHGNIQNGIGRRDWAFDQVMPELTRRAVLYIEEKSKGDRPFFLYFATTSPHTPIVPTKEFQGRSGAGSYGDFVIQTDYAIGKVVQTLKACGIWDNTLLIVTSDNGPEPRIKAVMADYGHFPAAKLRGMKWNTWEGGHRVPFVASWPGGGIQGGARRDELICLTDLYATLATVGGAPPDNSNDSLNVLPMLRGKGPVRTEMVYHGGSMGLGLRRGQWAFLQGGAGAREYPVQSKKLGIESPDADLQLFDLSMDPSQRVNVADKHPERVREMAARLSEVSGQKITR